MKLILCFFSLYVGLSSCSSDDTSSNADKEPSVTEALIKKDIAYGSHPLQTYDFYLPANRSESTTKVVVLVHGGGWTSGDKADMAPFLQLIQNKGNDYAIANVNYVLADSTTKAYPNQVNDLEKAIAHIKNSATENKTKSEFAFVGVSAGAHLSLLYAYAFDPLNEVKAVSSIIGPTDFTDPKYLNNPQYVSAFPFLVENLTPNNTELLKIISPSFQVTTDAPPTIMFYGNEDPLIPNTQHQRLRTSLEQKDVIHDLTVYNGGHGNWDAASYIDLDTKLNVFLKEHL